MREERKQVRLSDAFRKREKLESALECVATYLNVNYGYNQEIMSQCQKLYEYAYLIEEIRKHIRQGYRLEAAVEHAIDHCIEQDILADFLRRRRAEVTMNLLTEYDEELHIRSEKELSFREGKEIGIQSVQIDLITKKLQKGMSIEEIADILEMSVDTVQKLVSEMNIDVSNQQVEEILKNI